MKTQVKRLRRLGWWLLCGLPAVLVALHTLYWQLACRQLDLESRSWMARCRAAGCRIDGAPPTIGGWPMSAQLTFANPGAMAPDGTGWAGERLILRVDLWRPDRLSVDAPGVQRLILGSGDAITFKADRQHLGLPTFPADAPVEFAVSANGISLPASMRPVLGTRIDSLSAAGQITHAADLLEIPSASSPVQWRDRGGAIDLHEFALLWGKLGIAGHATLALDARLQPAGDATAAISGFADAIAQLADARQIPRPMAMLATGALSMLADPSGTAKVPLRLEAGRLTVSRFPLLTVPEIVWPR